MQRRRCFTTRVGRATFLDARTSSTMMASTSSIAAPIARISTHRRAASAKPRGVVRARDTAAGASAPAIDASSDQVRSWMFRPVFARMRAVERDGARVRGCVCARSSRTAMTREVAHGEVVAIVDWFAREGVDNVDGTPPARARRRISRCILTVRARV